MACQECELKLQIGQSLAMLNENDLRTVFV